MKEVRIAFAGGVEKIFYYAGTCGGVNSDSLQDVFYKFAGQPHKVYAAQVVLAHLLRPTCRFVKQLPLGEGVRGYLFRDGQRLVGIVWVPSGVKAKSIRLANERLHLHDLMGRPQPQREFTPDGTPVYILADDLTDQAFQAALVDGDGALDTARQAGQHPVPRVNAWVREMRAGATQPSTDN